MVQVDNLIAHPLDVGSRHAFVIRAGVASNLKNKTGQIVGSRSQHVTQYRQVHGDSRVVSATLNGDPNEPHTCYVDLAAYAGAGGGNNGPCYWLPWHGNQIYRVMLKPSQHLAGGTVDPDVFFTANLNGCMVSVEGAANQPIVYHANVVGYLGDPGGDAGMVDATARSQMRRKRYKMHHYGYRRFSETVALDKKPAGGGLPAAGHVTQLHYQVLRGRASAAEVEQLVRFAAAGRFHLSPQQLAMPHRQILVNDAMGTVFGVKQGGNWSFYYQKLVHYEYLLNDVYQGGDWLVIDCKQFWPGVAGFSL